MPDPSLATASAPAAQKAIAPPLAVPDTTLEITSDTSLRFAWGERAGFATGEVNLLTGFSLELDVGSTFISPVTTELSEDLQC